MSKVKLCIVLGFLLLLILATSQLQKSFDGKLHVVICDVGQGDAIFIRTPAGKEMIIDGGPDESVLSCLDEYRPFWDRSLDVMVLTHPHYDHFRGLIDVLDRYAVRLILQEPIDNTSEAYKVFTQAAENEKSNLKTSTKGTTIIFADGVELKVLGPDQAFLSKENPRGIIGNDNPPSLIMHLSYNSFDLLLTGDSDGQDLERFVPAGLSIDALVLPHHGSKNGYTPAASKYIIPIIGIISAGKDNSYGHPHQSVLTELQKHNSVVLRTDLQGNIHLIIDKNGNIFISPESKSYSPIAIFQSQ